MITVWKKSKGQTVTTRWGYESKNLICTTSQTSLFTRACTELSLDIEQQDDYLTTKLCVVLLFAVTDYTEFQQH